MRFSKAVVKYRIPILILTVLLMIPAVLGMANTRINYDMLNYLPEDMDTIIGQNELMEDFGKGAFSFIIVEDQPGIAPLFGTESAVHRADLYQHHPAWRDRGLRNPDDHPL